MERKGMKSPQNILPDFGVYSKYYLENLEAGIQWSKIYMYEKKQNKGLRCCGREERDMTAGFEERNCSANMA